MIDRDIDMKRILASSLLLLAFLVYGPAPSAAAGKIGVVLMHGSRGTTSAHSPLAPLMSALRRAGILYVAPEMPWSRARYIDKDVEGSLKEIDRAVATLKAKGATVIVVGGHSIGANAAMIYGAHRKGVAGVMAIAPGHVPSLMGWQAKMHYDYRRAEKLVKAGKGNSRASFHFFVQGHPFTKSVKAEVYYSWFDPFGEATFAKNAEALQSGAALLWIVGRNDTMAKRGKYFAYAKAPKNPRSEYVVVSGGHMATPRIGAQKIVAWLQAL